MNTETPSAGPAGKTAVIVLPVFNDWDSVFSLLPLIDAQLAPMGLKGRVLIVDDGSTAPKPPGFADNLKFKAIEQIDELVLTRNLGNQRALACAAGYAAAGAAADFIVVMDSDHEDNPVYIPELIRKAETLGGGTIVFAERTRRSEGRVFKIMYWCYQRIFRLITGAEITIGNYCVIPGGLIARVAQLNELWTHFPAAVMRSRISFTAVPAERGRRIHGKGSMPVTSLITHAFGGFWLHADVFAARTLAAAAVLSILIVLTGAGLLVVNFMMQESLVTRWTFVGLGMLTIVLFQVIGMAVSIMFLAALARAQTLAPPARVYGDFVLEKRRLL